MYICICNGYREREVRDAALRGARTVEDAYQALGNGPCCGCCVAEAQEFIEQTLAGCAAAAE